VRHLAGFVYLLAGLLASPLVASAERGKDDGTSILERWYPEAFVNPNKPAVQLKLDSTALEVPATGPRTADDYALEEVNRLLWRARMGVTFSVMGLTVGALFAGGGSGQSDLFRRGLPTS